MRCWIIGGHAAQRNSLGQLATTSHSEIFMGLLNKLRNRSLMITWNL